MWKCTCIISLKDLLVPFEASDWQNTPDPRNQQGEQGELENMQACGRRRMQFETTDLKSPLCQISECEITAVVFTTLSLLLASESLYQTRA